MQEEIKLIGRRIRLLRTAKNLTQTGLAKEMGISQTHLCNIECGRVPVTLPNLLKLHSLLECNMSSFFVDLDEQADAKDKDISLEEVLQIVKLLKKKVKHFCFTRRERILNSRCKVSESSLHRLFFMWVKGVG